MKHVAISSKAYAIAAEAYAFHNPVRAALLSRDLKGKAWYFPEHRGYVVLADVSPGVIEIRGAFKIEDGAPGFATAIVDWCRKLGANTVQLDCYESIVHVWLEQDFAIYAVLPFDRAMACDDWPEVYGTPDVLYMRKHFGG